MRTQKNLRFLALLVALFLLLSACGGSSRPSASSKAESTVPVGTAIPSASAPAEESNAPVSTSVPPISTPTEEPTPSESAAIPSASAPAEEPTAPVGTSAPPVSVPAEESADLPVPERKPLFHTVNGLSYPSELGAPVLGKAAADLADSASRSSASAQITNVGDAAYYLQSVEAFDQPFDTCNLFADLLEGDYDEVGLVRLSRPDNGYCLVYVRLDETYYPFDPFMLAKGASGWFYDPQYDCISATDLDALCEKLAATCPYNGENKPMTSWRTETLSKRASQAEPPSTEDNGTDPVPSTPEERLVAYLTTPQYTKEQIGQWVAEGLTLAQWAEKIKVPADAVQLLNTINYRENEYNDNVSFYDETNRLYWAAAWNAQTVFEYRSGNCAGTSNLMNALLSNDFDQQGYVQFGNNTGGHIFNYFVSDGIYVFCDFIGIPGACIFGGGKTYPADTDAYIVYVGSSAEAFGEWYCQDGFFAEGFFDPTDEMYLYNMVMYPREGEALPKGRDEVRKETIFGNSIWDVHPKQYQDTFTVLYEHEAYPLRFLPVPDPQTWPAETR